MHNGRSVRSIEIRLAEKFGLLPSQLSPELLALLMVGAEGDGDGDGEGEGDGGKGEGEGEGGSGKGSGDGDGDGDGDGEGDGEGDSKTYSQTYVENLRRQSGKYRTERNTLQEAEDERKKEAMSDLDRAKAEGEEQKVRADKAEGALVGVQMSSAIALAATKANFHNPDDATSLVIADDIATNEDGSPNGQSVTAAVKRLADDKPHLVKGKGGGSGDGGARGDGTGNVDGKKTDYIKHYQEQGGVPMPTD